MKQLRIGDITIDHTGWNTTLRDGRWVPTFPNARRAIAPL